MITRQFPKRLRCKRGAGGFPKGFLKSGDVISSTDGCFSLLRDSAWNIARILSLCSLCLVSEILIASIFKHLISLFVLILMRKGERAYDDLIHSRRDLTEANTLSNSVRVIPLIAPTWAWAPLNTVRPPPPTSAEFVSQST